MKRKLYDILGAIFIGGIMLSVFVAVVMAIALIFEPIPHIVFFVCASVFIGCFILLLALIVTDDTGPGVDKFR